MLQPIDPIGWARKPRSAIAFHAVLELAVRDEEPAFIEILEKLRKDGHVVGDDLVRRWDHVGNAWVKA